ncbi:MAG: DUF167 family protein [Alphaproteobacteria bacterium]|nr:DUF167 family protein [Alphaproteobacteria bacterium]
MTSFWRAGRDGVMVEVKVEPGSRRPGVGGLAPAAHGERLRIAVSEKAEDGRATRAACAALARALGLPPSAVSVAMGGSRREKLLAVAGDPVLLGERLDTL